MNPTQQISVLSVFHRLFAARPTQPVADWCEEELVFNEPNCQGPFSLAGREYLREPLNTWSDPNVTDAVLVFGARCGKTRVIMGGIGWMIENEPARVLWVMPNTHGTGGAQNVSRTRWQPMLRASECLSRLIPSGSRRHEFKSLQQIIGGSLIDFAGSNSPANLASNPARVVVLDEVDKFNIGGKKEADAAKLADERAKEFSNPKRFKTSTPTTYEGLIWQELLKTDFRRRFVPCPHCSKHVVFAWSPTYTVIPKTGSEAYVRWDKEACVDGKWDLERVRASAHAECPHCKGRILDQHKTKMDRHGEWRPTQAAANGYRGWHLPSMYSASKQTSFGALAVKFLQAKNSLQGLQGFINGDLAEPYQLQDRQSERIELVTSRIEVTAEWKKLLTVDCQQKAPHYWFVVRAWNGGNSKGLQAGPLDTADEIREVQLAHSIPDCAVMLDSGYGARSEAEVYRTCARFGEFYERAGKMPGFLGWMPSKGMPTRKRWKNDKGVMVPYFTRAIDPFLGTDTAGRVTVDLFEFASDFFKDILENLRKGKGGYKWEVVEGIMENMDEYWRHMDGQLKQPILNKRTGRVTHEWTLRSRHWPDHLFACEYAQVALASFYELFKLE